MARLKQPHTHTKRLLISLGTPDNTQKENMIKITLCRPCKFYRISQKRREPYCIASVNGPTGRRLPTRSPTRLDLYDDPPTDCILRLEHIVLAQTTVGYHAQQQPKENTQINDFHTISNCLI